MITTNTVLVLGAGASKPFGFPTGEELKNVICDKIKPGLDLYNNLLELDMVENDIIEFRDSLINTPLSSVDAFLELNMEKFPEFVDIGKIAIAHTLLIYEKASNIYLKMNEQTWFKQLFLKMSQQVKFDDFQKNNLSIITFNYDRTLEEYLINALKGAYLGYYLDEYKQKISSIPVIHVYGKLGYLPWENDTYVKYGSDVHLEDLIEAYKKIKLIPDTFERIENDEDFKLAHEKLRLAHNVYFIGFGYHPTNLKRLKVSSNLGFDGILGGTRKNVHGTALDFRGQEIEDVKKLFNLKYRIYFHNMDAKEFIRNVPWD